MVDNENQWDEIEYSDTDTDQYQDYDFDSQSNLDSNSTDSEYSEEDYENNYEETEDGYDYDNQEKSSSSKKNNMLPIIVLALLLIGVGGFFAVSKLSNNTSTDKSTTDTSSVEQNDSVFGNSSEDDSFFDQNSETDDMMSVNFNETGDAQVKSLDDTGDSVTTIKNSNEDNDLFSNTTDFGQEKTNENNDIIISYDKAVTRINPFKPPFVNNKSNDIAKYASIQNTEFEIIEPPTESVADKNLEKLLKTQISGILYDDISPSAIVNLNGVDTFVKAGDTIHGFKIDAITRNKVQITYKNNTYTAAVGELFTTGTIDKPTVANLEKKFAGRYK